MTATSSLSSLLVRDAVITVRAMEQAYQRQVIYGGSLDTILLEMGVVSEERLMQYLSLATGLPATDRSLLERPDPRGVEVCPPATAQEFRVVPVAFDGAALRILVLDPCDFRRLEALATRINLPIQPFVVPEFRFHIMIERVFGVATPSRYVELAGKLATVQAAHPSERAAQEEDHTLPATAPASTPTAEAGPAAVLDAGATPQPEARLAETQKVHAAVPPPTSMGLAVPVAQDAPAPEPAELADAVPESASAPARELAPIPAPRAATATPAAPPAVPAAPPSVPAAPPPVSAAPPSVPAAPPPVSAAPPPVSAAPPSVPAAPPPVSAAPPPVSAAPPSVSAAPTPEAQAHDDKATVLEGLGAATSVQPGPEPTPPAFPGEAAPTEIPSALTEAVTAPVMVAQDNLPTAPMSMPELERILEAQLAAVAEESAARRQASLALPSAAVLPPPTALPPPAALAPPATLTPPAALAPPAGQDAAPTPPAPVPSVLPAQATEAPVSAAASVPATGVPATDAAPSRTGWHDELSFDASPIEPREAAQLLGEAADRDSIFVVLVRAARARMRYAAVLSVQGGSAFGRLAIDQYEADTVQIGQVKVPLDRPTVFRAAVESASPYIGPVTCGQPDLELVIAAMGETLPPSGLVLPIAIRDRVVALLYAHRGPEPFTAADVAELLPLASEAAKALGRLIVRAKQGRKPEPIGAATTPSGQPGAAAAPPPDPGTATNSPGQPGSAAAPPPDPGTATNSPGQPGSAAAPPPDLGAAGSPGPAIVTTPDAVTLTPSVSWRPAAAPTASVAPEQPTATPYSAPVVTRGDANLTRLLDDLEAGEEPAASRASDALLALTPQVLAEIGRRFPGRLWLDRYNAGGRSLRASQHGPLLAFLVRVGAGAAPLLVDRLAAEDRETRYYAALVCGEVTTPAATAALAARLFDPDYGVRAAALNALLACPPREVETVLEPVRRALFAEPDQARAAAQALGALRDVPAVPELIEAAERERAIADDVRRALVDITKQDFGTKARKWRSWWEKNRHRPRIEWMLDSLAHSDDAVRMSAGEELKRLTGEYFGYHYDLPKREREEARQRWVKWWQETGRRRFVRE